MSRSIMRFVNWRIAPNRGPDVPQMHVFECTTCAALDAPDDAGARSPASADVTQAQDWALRHSGRRPDHTGFREIVTRYWRTEMVDDGPPAP
jgi:hypothetical protein